MFTYFRSVGCNSFFQGKNLSRNLAEFVQQSCCFEAVAVTHTTVTDRSQDAGEDGGTEASVITLSPRTAVQENVNFSVDVDRFFQRLTNLTDNKRQQNKTKQQQQQQKKKKKKKKR